MHKKGYADILLGLQYGDEGKARVIDYLAKDYDIIARFNGGANAGHTIKQGDITIALHQIPSGIFYPQTTLYIGSGCVVNIEKLAAEIQLIKDVGINLHGRLKIASQASIVQPHHILLDQLLGKKIGTTKNGIGPAYANRAIRMYGKHLANIRLADILDDPQTFFRLIEENLTYIQKQYHSKEKKNLMLERIKQTFAQIAPFIEVDPLYMEQRAAHGAKILFEGAQSVMLDVVKGSVPYVTSSSTIASAAYTGGDLPLKYHRKIIGVAKALMSRVGYGPFPSEFGGSKSEHYTLEEDHGKPKHTKTTEAKEEVTKLIASPDAFDMGMALRILSGEYGATTSRPRRIGAFDLVQLVYAVKMNGVDELVITKCDTLREYAKTHSKKIPVVTGYDLDGKKIAYVPGATAAFYRVKPVIKYYQSFSKDLSTVRQVAAIPHSLKTLLKDVEKACGCRVIGLGVGPEREQYINLV
ncbi:MAG: adenylosuccinate synthetase [Patescibacteria group bacterium]